MESIVSVGVVFSLVLGPLLVRRWLDGRQASALALRACIGHALRVKFHGEPLLSLEVRPPMPWRAGRVILSAPRGMERLLAAAWSTVAGRVPEGYLIVVPAPGRASRPLRQQPAAA